MRVFNGLINCPAMFKNFHFGKQHSIKMRMCYPV